MGEMLGDDDVLRHVVDLRHLITDGETPWDKFQLVGLSRRDGFVYLVAYKTKWNLPEIAIFRGSPLLPNSWKLISRFLASRFLKNIHTLTARVALSSDFSQIGIIVHGKESHQAQPFNHIQSIYCFVLFDIYSLQWNDRPFLWEYYYPTVYLDYHLSHTCAGWILYPNCVTKDVNVLFRLSMDSSDDCVSVWLQFRVKPDQRPKLFVTDDNLYCFSSEHDDRFVHKVYIKRDGSPRERYMVDSDDVHLQIIGLDFEMKFMHDVPIFKALTCTRTSDNEPCSYADQTLVSKHFCPIYSVILDSDTKRCRVEKISQFMDRAALARSSIHNYANGEFMVYGIADGMLTKSKRIGIFDGLRVDQDVPTLYLENVFFKPPTLKELCSLTLVKALCQKTNHVVQLRYDAGTFSMDTWSGGPSDEVYAELGLNMPTLNFGQMEP